MKELAHSLWVIWGGFNHRTIYKDVGRYREITFPGVSNRALCTTRRSQSTEGAVIIRTWRWAGWRGCLAGAVTLVERLSRPVATGQKGAGGIIPWPHSSHFPHPSLAFPTGQTQWEAEGKFACWSRLRGQGWVWSSLPLEVGTWSQVWPIRALHFPGHSDWFRVWPVT